MQLAMRIQLHLFLSFWLHSFWVHAQQPGLSSVLGTAPLCMSHHINTTANEYMPVPTFDGSGLYFSAMDRTGFFDYKLDFTKVKNAGGEDIFYSRFRDGVFEDARPISFLNTNGHEVVTHSYKDGSLLLVGNYSENYGPAGENVMEGAQTTDIFKAKKTSSGYQITHYPEPLNSIFGEFDAISNSTEDYMIFASDRPGHVGAYHKKGWLWNNSFWGNTDIYVSIRTGYEWSVPVSLGTKVNTPYAERSPWLSTDGKRLYISSNGHRGGKTDMDIYYFTRSDVRNWTEWQGPFPMTLINTEADEWGYKVSNSQFQFFSRSKKLDFIPTQKGADAGFRETNFRPNYVVTGAQSASFSRNERTDIYIIPPPN